jgi:hypothetical protein
MKMRLLIENSLTKECLEWFLKICVKKRKTQTVRFWGINYEDGSVEFIIFIL